MHTFQAYEYVTLFDRFRTNGMHTKKSILPTNTIHTHRLTISAEFSLSLILFPFRKLWV